MKVTNCLVPAVLGKVIQKEGYFALPEELGVAYGSFPSWVTEAFSARTGIRVVQKPQPDGKLSLEKDEVLAEEGYRLCVDPDGIQVAAKTERGIIWALTTLVVLMEDRKVPCGEIEDAPRFSYRGQSFDVVRHFFPVEEVKKVIEGLSLAKINVLHWHLTDDQGWRIEIGKYPNLTADDDSYTQDEIRAVIAFAKVRGVEIIPEIDMPGHMSAALHAYPELGCDGKPVRRPTGGGIFKTILCAGKDFTYRFLEDVLDEVTALFPSEYFHIGGDEAPKMAWEACPDCKARLALLKLNDFEELQTDFNRRVTAMLAARGKKVICWNDVLKGGADPEHMQIQYWIPTDAEKIKAFAEAGGSWVYSDAFERYFDYPYAINSMRKAYLSEPSWMGDTAAVTCPPKGVEGCMWTERIWENERLEKFFFPRVQATAENAWSGPGSYTEFKERLQAYLMKLQSGACGKMASGIQFTAPEGWDPTGAAAEAEGMEYMKLMEQTSDPDDINSLFPQEDQSGMSEEEQQEYGRMMRERGPKVHIRPYQASDRPGVEHVCLVTASDYLNSTEELRQATLDTYCHYYIEREPEHCFVIADENNDAVGYIFCAQDYTAWKKCFTEEYLEKTENPYTKKMGYAEIEGYIELAEDFPAHLHIDIDPAYQRKGYGSQLVDALVAHLKAIGVKGVMLETGASNEKGMNFYKKYGFEVLRDDGQGVCFGIRL